MAVQDLFQSLAERLQQSASARSVFGEPIAAQGRTIIPVVLHPDTANKGVDRRAVFRFRAGVVNGQAAVEGLAAC